MKNGVNRDSVVVVSASLSRKIERVELALISEFGCDHAFTIMGKGQIVAASNYKEGRVWPLVRVKGGGK